MTYVPHAGNGLGDAMWEQGYTEADMEPVVPCTVCGHWDGDDNTINHPCVAQAELDGFEADKEDDFSESGNFDRQWYLD